MPRLFHFSDDPAIAVFEPRPVRVPSQRAAGMDWLNGPLVWAIEEARHYLYLFPRDCPRIVMWATADSADADRRRWLDDAPAVAHIEADWLERLRLGRLTRYELDPTGFEDLADAGMWVSRQRAEIIGRIELTDLPEALQDAGVRLEVHDSLLPLREAWESSLHVSGVRLRNARGWVG